MVVLNIGKRSPNCSRLVLMVGLGLALCFSRPASCEELRREGRRLLWGQRPIQLVGYSYYGLIGDRQFDSEGFLDTLAAHNINFTRFFLILPWPVEPGPNLLPFAKVGDKYDLRQPNGEFFVRLRSIVKRAEELGIICQVCLFDRCGLSVGDELAWKNNPYNAACNVSGLLEGPPGGYPPFCHTEGPIAEINAAFIRKVVETIGDRSNVMYEIINEPVPELGPLPEWHAWVARELRKNLSTHPGSKVVSADRTYNDDQIEVFSMHRAGSEGHVSAAINQSKGVNKPIILSDDGDADCMFDPRVTSSAAVRALKLGQHFEHLEYTITLQREQEKRPASRLDQIPALAQLNLRNLSEQSIPLPGRPYVHSGMLRKTDEGYVYSAHIERLDLAQRILGELSSNGGRTWSETPVSVSGSTVVCNLPPGQAGRRNLFRVVLVNSLSHRLPGPANYFGPANQWAIEFGREIVEAGLLRVRPYIPDGALRPARRGGRACYETDPDRRGKYAYFRLEDSFPRGDVPGPVTITVEFFDDSADGRLILEYDGQAGPYTAAAPGLLEGSGKWKSISFRIDDARFRGGQNDGADLRLSLEGDKSRLALSFVRLYSPGK